jgi:hypothetical protein
MIQMYSKVKLVDLARTPDCRVASAIFQNPAGATEAPGKKAIKNRILQLFALSQTISGG